MYFPEEEEEEMEEVQDLWYGLGEGDSFTEYEINLLTLVSMRVSNTTPTLDENCSFADSTLEYKRHREEEEFNDMRMELKRPLPVDEKVPKDDEEVPKDDEEVPEDDDGVSPAKKLKLHNEESAEQEEPGAFQECSDRLPEVANAIHNPFGFEDTTDYDI